jgi:hypothetical protein
MNEDGVDCIREVLSGRTIHLDKLDADADVDTGIFDHVEAFVNLSKENETVEEVTLCLATDPDDHGYAIWDKIAEGIGNLQALDKITIVNGSFYDGEEDPLAPDWEILACILRRLRHGIQLCMQDDEPLPWDMEALPAFARVIHGQAMIKAFSTGYGFPFHCFDILCSALLTLPALEHLLFEQLDGQESEEEQSLESMIKLLQSPTLWEVAFIYVVFSNTLSQAVAKALKERSGISTLRFQQCSFPEGANRMIARVLKTNTTLKYLQFQEGTNVVFYEVLAEVLRSNSTLQYLELSGWDDSARCSWLSPLFLALQVNKGLKELIIHGIEVIDEKLSTAMRLGLARNSTLETLNLGGTSADTDTSFWREALSFLRTNTSLKTLYMEFEQNMTESLANSIRKVVLAMLRENGSLETLSMTSPAMMSQDVRLEDYLVFIAAIHPNTTLKSFCLHEGDLGVDDDETKSLITVLKKNYGLEEIPGLRIGAGDIRSIFKLNRAGRRYLVQDGTSIWKGVDVLSCVNYDINSVFLHLLENPVLCDRRAVEVSSTIIGDMDNAARSTPSPGNRHSGDKREQEATSQLAKVTRRRLK